jgi:predicted house-cleaning noncanonical NTP pyrophosphatase (MazG superfamily)
MDDRDGIAEIRRGVGRRVDAHVAHRADHDDLLDALLIEQGLEARVAE